LHQFQEEKQKERGLNITEFASLIKTLTSQLSYLLKTEHRTILGYNPENIIVINGHIFAHLGSEVISNKLEDNMVLISYPFTSHDFFVSPELLTIKELPSYCHYKTAYFSLGCLALYTLLSDNEFYTNYLQEQKQEQEQIPINLENLLKSHPIKHTKLYWLLSRCLMKDPKTRSILFI
jgi:serine/threonine protein kinase